MKLNAVVCEKKFNHRNAMGLYFSQIFSLRFQTIDLFCLIPFDVVFWSKIKTDTLTI